MANSKLVTENKKFCQTIKQYFLDKGNFSSKIVILEKDWIAFNVEGLSEIFNEQIFTSQTKCVRLFIQCDKIRLKLFVEIISENKYK